MNSFDEPNLLAMTFAMAANFAVILAAMVFQFVLLNGQISFKKKRWGFLFGLVFGLFCIISMIAPIRQAEGIAIDARFVLTMISTIFGGPVSGFVTALIASIYRWHIGGIGFYGSTPALLSAILVGLIFIKAHIPVERRLARILAFLWAGLGLFVLQVVSGLTFLWFFSWEEVKQITWDNNLPALFLYPPITVIMGACLDFILARHHLSIDREHLLNDLERHNKELDVFNSVLQHEFRSPLVSIQGFLGELEEHLLAKDFTGVKTDIQYLHESANRLSSLVVALTQYNSARAEWPQPYNSVKTLLDKFKVLWPTVRIQCEIEAFVCCGNNEFFKIFEPILNNATRFSLPEKNSDVSLTVSRKQPYIQFAITDTGRGMDFTTVANAFNLFYRSNNDSSGSSASLATVKRIINAIHGDISIESPGLNQGCTVRIFLLEKEL